MKIWRISYFLLLFTSLYCFPSYITVNAFMGRFGDNLALYLKTRWLAYHYQISFLPKPFLFSDHLKIEDLDPVPRRNISQYVNIHLNRGQTGHDTRFNKKDHVIYSIHFHFRPKGWKHWTTSLLDIQDVTFKNLMQQYIQPKIPILKLELPQDKICVALHVRKGGGFDPPLLSDSSDTPSSSDQKYADKLWPLKFPPDSYYVEQLQRVYEYFNKQPLYVFLFTDDPDPAQIAARYSKILNQPNIEFNYRKSANTHDSNVLEDFFNMTRFDALIRSDSSFAVCAQFLGNFKLVIAPQHFIWQNTTLIIDSIKIFE